MAESLFTGTLQTFDVVGIREDLSDVITNISPTETPFYSLVRKAKTTSRNPAWQKDTLAAADGDNKQVEGFDVEGDTLSDPTRLTNYVQLQDKTIVVSDTANAVDTAGRSSELKYQTAKAGQELSGTWKPRSRATTLPSLVTPQRLVSLRVALRGWKLTQIVA